MNRYFFRPTILFFIVSGILLPAKIWAQDSAAVSKITEWILANDSETDLRFLKKAGPVWRVTRILKANLNEQNEQELLIWREHFFKANGEWMESRTSINSELCSGMSLELCNSIAALRKAFETKYKMPITGSYQLIQMPAYNWFEIPMNNGTVLFDLWGNFIEERQPEE